MFCVCDVFADADLRAFEREAETVWGAGVGGGGGGGHIVTFRLHGCACWMCF